MIDKKQIKILTFDCYGTLIDWEGGILGALKPVLSKHNINLDDNSILEMYADIESNLEKGEFINYKNVLKGVMLEISKRLNFSVSESELECLVNSLKDWKPFPDTVEALLNLKKEFQLAVISNIDNDLFSSSAEQLKVKFDYLITAEQIGSYKPSINNFRFAVDKMGISPNKILHVAQSIYHDIVPAKSLGLSTVWVNRRKGKDGFGATPPASEKPDLEVPDLKTLVEVLDIKH